MRVGEPQTREIEVKLELASPAEAAALRQVLGAPSARHQQTNLYYDTLDEAWRGRGWSVRVRREDGVPELTLKGNKRDAGQFRDCDEHTVKLPLAMWAGLRAGGAIAPYVEALAQGARLAIPSELDAHKLTALGATDTSREVFAVPGLPEAKLELDTTIYPGGKVFYEAEVEVRGGDDRDAVLKRLEQLFASAGLAARVSKVTKQSRFREIWRASRAA